MLASAATPYASSVSAPVSCFARACTAGAVVGADDVEGVEQAVDERPRDADRDGRQHEGQNDRADGRVG